MLRAKGHYENGEPFYLLALSSTNLERMIAYQPAIADLSDLIGKQGTYVVLMRVMANQQQAARVVLRILDKRFPTVKHGTAAVLTFENDLLRKILRGDIDGVIKHHSTLKGSELNGDVHILRERTELDIHALAEKLSGRSLPMPHAYEEVRYDVITGQITITRATDKGAN